MFDRRSFLAGSGALAATATAMPWQALDARGLATLPAPEREAMVPVRGGRVYVRVNGRIEGPRPPVIFIHGGPGGTHPSLLNMLALTDDRAVILYDQLDSGLSDRPSNPANWSLPRFVDELDTIRTSLGIARWHVVGHSWGGTIALEYGARRSPALAGLVLASPLVSTKSWIADADALRRKMPAGTQAILRACDPPARITPTCEAATTDFYRLFNAREANSQAIRDYVAARQRLRFNQQIYEAMWGSSEFVATGTLKDYDGEPLLDRLDGSRTLFICGQYDEARPVTIDGFAERSKADFAVIPGAAHGLFTDRPDETLGILRPWLREHDL